MTVYRRQRYRHNCKLFTGHQWEGSLYFMQARFYDPTLGRFLSPDSIVQGYGNPHRKLLQLRA